MKKDELLDIILDLPSKHREQLAEEIYQSLKPGEESLNASWIVEANHHMQRLEDTPPALPEEGCNDDLAHDGSDETTEVPDHQMIENIWVYIDRLRFHFGLEVALRDTREGTPHEEVMREIQEYMEQHEDLLGGLEMGPRSSPDVTAVRPLDDFKLHLTFAGGGQRVFDMQPYCRGLFAALQDPEYFSWVRVHQGGIQWPEREGMGARRLYKNSDPVAQ